MPESRQTRKMTASTLIRMDESKLSSLLFRPFAWCTNDLAHSSDQLSGVEGLCNTAKTTGHIPGVTGHEEDWQLRVKFHDAIRQVDAVHVRHCDISQQHRDAGLVLPEKAESFLSVGRSSHCVSGIF